jgi:hypothetical protein
MCMYETVISTVLCHHEILSLTLREERKLQVSEENKVLRNIVDLQRDEVTVQFWTCITRNFLTYIGHLYC